MRQDKAWMKTAYPPSVKRGKTVLNHLLGKGRNCNAAVPAAHRRPTSTSNLPIPA
ncbi:MAG: hypothetical protein JW706_06545 [Opitutales bacterium]|nr:hypothetical protein [Opitutales bacterium]